MHSEGQLGLESGLAGWWRLGARGRGTVSDIIGTNDCTPFGGLIFGLVSGHGCATFDGVDDYAETGGNISGISGDFSISFWVNTTVVGANNVLINRYVGGDATQMYIEVNSGPVRMVLWDGANGIRESSSSINTGSWVHVAFARSGSGIDVYVNGVLDNGSTSGTLTKAVTAGPLTIGRYGGTYFLGSMSDVRLYNSRALSATEIARLARIY